MQAAVLVKPNTIEVKDIDKPHCSVDEVLVKVAFCGICGSDVPRVFEGTSRMYPNVLGHEFSGTIEQVGDRVDASLLGLRVSGVPLIPCMHCDACTQGNFALCESYDFIGSRRFGALAEYVAVPASNVYPLAEGTGLLEASFFEPAAVAMHAIDLTAFKPGAAVAIMGCGTIGVILGQIALALGASKVVAVGRRKSRLDVAQASGIKDVIDTSKQDWKNSLFALNDNKGFDFVFETSGNADFMSDSFSIAGIKACVCMVGTPKKEIQFSVSQWEELNRKELTVMGSWMSYSSPFPGKEWKKVSDMFDSGAIHSLEHMLDTIYPLSQAQEAFGRFKNQQSINGKLVIQCNDFGF